MVDDQYLQDHPAANQGEEPTPASPQVDDPGEEDNPNPDKERLEAALLDLIKQAEREDSIARRAHFRDWLEAEEYWNGHHHSTWNEQLNSYRTPMQWAIENNKNKDDIPRYQYVTNIYRRNGLAVIAAISQKLPKVRFEPKSANSERDIATGKAASDVADLIERNNNLDLMAIREAYLLWTQGVFFAYVRYKLDKQFGTMQVPILESVPVKVSDEHYQCDQCGAETPASGESDDGLMGQEGTACQSCGAPLDAGNYQPAEMANGVAVTGMKDYPRGQEVVTIYGAMNVKVSPRATEQRDTGYLILEQELSKGAIRATHPDKADAIGKEGGGAEDDMERIGREQAATSTASSSGSFAGLKSYLTYKQAWLRPWMFWNIDDDELRQLVIENYPDGAFLAIEGDNVLYSCSEDLDDKWEMCVPMPGEGAYRDGAGRDTLSVNKRLNDAHNITAEHIEFASAPPIFVDSRFINMAAMAKRRMQPGNFFPVHVQAGARADTPLDKLMYQPQLRVDSNIYQYGKDLIELGQIMSSAMPSIFGGSVQDVKTAAGYSMAREQSLGLLNLFWRTVKQFHARVMLKGVECFRKNRTQDEEITVFGESSQYTSKFIRLGDLKGNITAHPDADEDFPMSWTEIRSNVMQLIQVAPEKAQEILFHPANSPMLTRIFGNAELILPAADDRDKQYREIDLLVQSQPVTSIDPMTGQQTQQTSIMPDALVDDHSVHILTCKEWAVSDSGITAKQENPMGYANVMLHVAAHLQAAQQMQAMMQPQPPPQPQLPGRPQGQPQLPPHGPPPPGPPQGPPLPGQ